MNISVLINKVGNAYLLIGDVVHKIDWKGNVETHLNVECHFSNSSGSSGEVISKNPKVGLIPKIYSRQSGCFLGGTVPIARTFESVEQALITNQANKNVGPGAWNQQKSVIWGILDELKDRFFFIQRLKGDTSPIERVIRLTTETGVVDLCPVMQEIEIVSSDSGLAVKMPDGHISLIRAVHFATGQVVAVSELPINLTGGTYTFREAREINTERAAAGQLQRQYG